MQNSAITKGLFALIGVLVGPLVTAQSGDIPRTEYGQPDFQGTYTFRTITPLNRPRELEHLATLTPEQAVEWEEFELRRQNRDLIIDSVGGAGYPPGVISYNNFWYERGDQTIADRRTSLIYDPPNGRSPRTNAAGRDRRQARGQMVFESAGPEGRTTVDRCLTGFVGGPPMIPGSYNNNMQIVQTRDHIMILNEMVHSARIIRIDSEHHTKQLKWEGDSVAHWDGDTLVIHTQNWYHDYNLRGMSKQAEVEERINWIDENTLDYDFTVTDALSWDVSWSARLPLRRSPDPVYEYACHEGNHGLIGILAGWRRYESMGFNGDGSPKSDTGTVETEEN
ncbi:MAG TPA: hypothetical protein QGF41_00230 [Gammaproteobacteria bacterium]|jgi:hypothetical protein|nr:hypothetical protein [Gammaproteobacteria bacterium]|tara:strand:+ start:3688 stop:4698 length:1011 start_codon:yes stop_codon:yes gene_type:complete